MIKLYHVKDLKYNTDGFQRCPLEMSESESIEGYFLTDTELKRVAQEAWEAAMPRLSKDYTEKVADGTMTPELAREALKAIYFPFKDFDHYWAEQQAREGEV